MKNINRLFRIVIFIALVIALDMLTSFAADQPGCPDNKAPVDQGTTGGTSGTSTSTSSETMGIIFGGGGLMGGHTISLDPSDYKLLPPPTPEEEAKGFREAAERARKDAEEARKEAEERKKAAEEARKNAEKAKESAKEFEKIGGIAGWESVWDRERQARDEEDYAKRQEEYAREAESRAAGYEESAQKLERLAAEAESSTHQSDANAAGTPAPNEIH